MEVKNPSKPLVNYEKIDYYPEFKDKNHDFLAKNFKNIEDLSKIYNGCKYVIKHGLRRFRRYKKSEIGGHIKWAQEKILEEFHEEIQKYENKYSGLIEKDIAQEGRIGLLKAFDNYEHERAPKIPLENWAGLNIEWKVLRCLYDEKTIAVPPNVSNQLRKIKKIQDEFNAEHARKPTLEELAELTKIAEDKINEMLIMAPKIMSLDEIIPSQNFYNEDSSFADIMEDRTVPDGKQILDAYSNKELRKRINSIGREYKKSSTLRKGINVLYMHAKKEKKSGKTGEKPKQTFEEIGKRFGITRSRAHQLEKIAIKKLRHELNSLI